MTFHVGQKVVCIHRDFEDQELARSLGVTLPTKDSVYTIREFEHRGSDPALRLLEIRNPHVMHQGDIWAEPAFDCESFRPLVEKKTDISVFTKLLTPTPQHRELVSSVNGEGINAR